MKRRSRRTELKFVCERVIEKDKRIVSKGRHHKRRGLCERLLRAVCLLYQLVCLFVCCLEEIQGQGEKN